MQYIRKGKNERKCKPATPLSPLGSRQMTTTQSFHSKKLYDKGGIVTLHFSWLVLRDVKCSELHL